jgi:HPr kinase/phosphorylase
MTPPPGAPLVLHASCVAAGGRGLLVLGPSGAGKSALCLQLLALGARLVSDDRTALFPEDGALLARCPAPAQAGQIEARFMGLLNAPAAGPTPVALVADLAQTETHRLPPDRRITILGMDLPLVLQVPDPHFPAALMLYLLHGRAA